MPGDKQSVRVHAVWRTGHQSDAILTRHDLELRRVIRQNHRNAVHFVAQSFAHDFDVEEVALFHLVQTGEHQRFNQPAVPGNDRMGGFTSHWQRRAVQMAGTRSQCFLGSAVIKRQIDGLLGHLDCAHHAVAGIKQ